jgi:tetratricopeptide (TPR) repeat protein
VKRALGAGIGVVALALALLAAGGIASVWVGDARPASNTSVPETAALAPAPAADKLEAAIESLQARVRADRDDWRSNASLGLAYLQKARLTVNPAYYTKAASALSASMAVNSRENFEGALGRGILAGARHDFTAALHWGRSATRISPYNADARGVVADALVELGRYGPARRALQAMVDLRPDLASFARVSYWRELHGDTRGAIHAMTQAFEAVGGAGQDAAWASFQLGELYFNSGNVDQASFAYRRARFLAPDYYLPKTGLAKVAAARGDEGRAIGILRRVVTTYPAPVYVMQLGDLYTGAGRDDRAAQQYALVEVEQRLFSSNGVEPDVEIVNYYSDHSKRLAWALETARRAWKIRPSVRVADALGWALYANGRPAEAQRYARLALRLGTRDPMYYFHAGMIATAAGDRERALRYLHRAFDINPNFSVAHDDDARAALRSLGGRS